MTHLLFVRPADDSTAGHVAVWGQAVLQLTSGFTTTDLYGSQAGRTDVDRELPTASSLLYFGHGTENALVAGGATLGFPLVFPLPMGMAIINGLNCLLTLGHHDVGCSASALRQGFDAARVDYKTNGPLYRLSPSDTRTAWLYAKSNRYSLQVHGDPSAML